MTMCTCTARADPHGCLWVLPWQSAALLARPVQTIHTWRKNGAISGRRCPDTGRWQVCNCEAGERARTTETRWVRSID